MTEGRTITPGMSPFDKFQKGDNVAHIRLGDGTVVANDGFKIRVQFAGDVTGIYDATWFRLNPGNLFHRGTAPLSQ